MIRLFLFVTILCVFSLSFTNSSMASEFNVAVFVSDSSSLAESAVVESFETIGGNTFKYTEFNTATGSTRPIAGGAKPVDLVKNGKLKFSDFNIIWFAWNGPGHDSDYFMAGVEEDILKLVENGGVVYSSAFDDNFRDQNGKQIGGWMPIDKFPCGIMDTGDTDAEITPEGEKTPLFTTPNKITNSDLSKLTLDDNLNPQSNEYLALAVRADNNKPAIAQLKYGKGTYIHCCIDARSTFPAATPLMENMLNYIATLGKSLAVDRSGKLSTVWADVKTFR